ncbi:unnamed protein product [Rotaria magnacalcarata]
MDQLRNFSPNDIQNGILAQMFRNAGINDVHSYIGEVHQMSNDENYIPVNNSEKRSVEPERNGGFLNNAQQIFDKRNDGKNRLQNAKQIFQMYKSLDKNGDGKITVEDVEILLKEIGLGFVSKHLARAIFDIIDTNHNGRLDFRDLLALTAILKRLSSTSVTSDRF